MFTKGQKVTYIRDWDRKGTVTINQLVVHSCGKKQMILVDENGKKFSGQNFLPKNEQYWGGVVVDRLEGDEAEKLAIEVAEKIIKKEMAHYNRCLEGGHGEGYDEVIRENIAKIHSPEFIWN